MFRRYLFLALVTLFWFTTNRANAQCAACDVGTTTFVVDFSSNPDTTYSLSSTRNGHCCGATGSTQCIKFEVTVHPQTTEIGFQVANPSPPGGAFYQVNCGPPTSLGTPLCVTGLDSFCITFCKSGGDSPTYTISASRSFAASPDVTIHSNCATDLYVTGLNEPSIVWNSIFPGALGAYNSYLSCTAACDTTTVTPQAGYPPYIDFVVSGTPVGCAVGTSSDTVRVYITPGIIPAISPNPATVCFGSSNATLTANATGGAPPYSYLWSTNDTSQSITVGAGTYWVAITDTTAGCPPVYDTVVVTANTGPITANAGPDTTICLSSPTIQLNGIVTQATGGYWTGGTGTFTPNDSTLNATYTPSAAELTAGTVTLTLTSTGNGGCPLATDQITITIQTVPIVSAGPDQAICEGDVVTLAGTVTGGAGTGQWSTSGTGTFAPNNTTLNATYTPSAADITAGTVSIILNATNACAPVADTMVITITPQIIVNAGPDQIICAGSLVNLAGSVTGGSTTGQWSTSGSGTFAPSNTALTGTYNPSAADITAGTVTLTLTSTNNGGCGPVIDQITITIQAPPTVNAGVDQGICEGDIVTLAGIVTGGAGTGQWTSSGTGTFSPNNTTLNATYTPSAADITAGSVTLTLTATGSCTAASDIMVITITPQIIVNAGPDQNICQGDVVNLSGSVTGGTTTGQWSSSGTGTFSPNNTTLNATYTPSAADITAGTVTLTLTSTNNGNCGVVMDQIIITISPLPIVNAGVDQTICQGDVVNLNGSVTVGSTTGQWSTSGSGIFSPNNTTLNASYIPSAADITAGTVTLTLSSTGGCQVITDQLVITILPAPLVNAGNDQTICANNALVNLNGSITVGGSQGQWSSTGTGTFTPNNTSLNATYTPSAGDITAGSVFLILTSTDGCIAVADTILVTITPAPIVNAGVDITMCANNVVPLNGSVTGTTTSGQWSTSGTGTFSPNNTTLNATYTPSAADTTAGSVVLTLTSTNNGNCNAENDQMTITFSPAPVVNAGNDVTVCANNSIVSLTGSVSGGSISGIWTTSGSGTFSPNNTTLNATYTPSAADITAGSITLTLTSTNNGTCLPVSDQMIITITPAPIVSAGNDVIVCQNSPAVSLNGSVTGGSSTGQWSTSGTGSFAPSNTTLTGTYNPSAADISAGTVTLILTSTNNGNCIPVTDTMIVTITTSPVVNAGPDITICNNNVVSLSGSVTGFTTTGIWTTSGTGTFSPNANSLNATYIPSPADTTNGSVTLTLTSTNNQSCNAETDQLVITFTSSPNVDAGTDIIVCANNLIANLNGYVSAPFNGLWSTLGTGSFSPSASTLNASYTLSAGDTTAGGTTLILESTNIGTCLPVYDTLTITMIQAPIANAGQDLFVCIGDSATLSGTITNGSGTGQWSTSGTGTFIPSNTNLIVTYAPSAADYSSGSIQVYLTSTNNGTCLPHSDTMTITFTLPPTVNAGTNDTICSNEVVQLSGSVSGTSTTGLWSTSGDGTFVPSDTILNAQYIPGPNDISNGSVTLTLSSTYSCLENDQITITINPGPIVDAGLDQIICIDDKQVNLSGVVSGSTTTGIWTSSGTGTFTPTASNLNATYNLSAADSAAGTFILILTSTNNGVCPAISDTLIVTLTTIPVVNAGPDTTFCANNFANLNGSITGGASTGIWSSSGTGTFSPSNTNLNALYQPSSADTTAGTVTLTLTSTGACVTVSDNIIITITPAPYVMAGNDTTICDSASLTLNGIVGGGSNTGQWSTTGDGAFSPSNTVLNATYTPGTNDQLTGSFDLILESTNNGDCIAESDTLTVTLMYAPTANAGQDQVVCGGSNVSLNGSVSGGAGGVWSSLGSGSFINPTNLGTDYIPSSADTAAGSVTLILSSDPLNPCGQDYDTLIVTFVTSPLVDAGADFSVCTNNDTINLSGTTSNGTGLWITSGDGAFIPGDSILNTSYLPGTSDHSNGQVTFILTIPNLQNCPAVFDTLLVTITPAPLVDAGNDISVCLSNPLVSLNGSISGASSSGYWITNGSGTFIPDSLSLGTNYQPSSADTAGGSIWFILTSTNNGNCLSESDTVNVTFDVAPSVSVGSDIIACQQDTALLNAIINGGGTVIWSTTNGGGIFTPDSASNPAGYLPVASDTTAPVEIIATYTNGCGTVSDTLYITVLPDPGLIMDYAVDCQTFEVQFNASISGGIIQSVFWDFGDGVTDTTVAPLHQYSTTGNYTVTLTVVTQSGCTDSTSQTIIIEPLPVADFNVSDSVVVQGTSIFFNDTSSNASSWVWDFGDLTGPYYVEDTSYTYTAPGTYLVTLIVYNSSGCSDTATMYIVVEPNDVLDPVMPPAIPNSFTPNGDGFNDYLIVRGGPFESFDLRVFNEWGNEIFKSESQEDGWDGTYNGKAQPGGIYMYIFKGSTIDGEEYELIEDINLIR